MVQPCREFDGISSAVSSADQGLNIREVKFSGIASGRSSLGAFAVGEKFRKKNPRVHDDVSRMRSRRPGSIIVLKAYFRRSSFTSASAFGREIDVALESKEVLREPNHCTVQD